MAHYEAGTRVDEMVGSFDRGTKVQFRCTLHNLDWRSKDPYSSQWFPMNSVDPFGDDHYSSECVSRECIKHLELIEDYDTVEITLSGRFYDGNESDDFGNG